MAKKPTLHPYSDQLSFQRLLLLIATLIHYPGVGCPEPFATETDTHHNALESVQIQLQQLAQKLEIVLPPGYPTTPTIRKDLQTLRDYSILDRRMYRWGYYLGTGAMSKEELKIAFNALQSQAKYQAEPQVRQIYQLLKQRLRGLDLEENRGDFFYPVKAYLNRPIIYTDPAEMMVKGKSKPTLFHCLETLETAIIQGQSVEIYRYREPYQQQTGYLQIYPLQIFYHDIAWYLLYEECSNQYLAVDRIDRFKTYCQIIDSQGRGQTAQWSSLKLAQKLMANGWGIYLGSLEEQQLEKQAKLKFTQIKVRFFPPVTAFILEGERRHPSQKIKCGAKDDQGKYEYVDYLACLENKL
ncbi:MAG: WYL domain-containing protein [Coleofasciculaceae cyanobacterium]